MKQLSTHEIQSVAGAGFTEDMVGAAATCITVNSLLNYGAMLGNAAAQSFFVAGAPLGILLGTMIATFAPVAALGASAKIYDHYTGNLRHLPEKALELVGSFRS